MFLCHSNSQKDNQHFETAASYNKFILSHQTKHVHITMLSYTQTKLASHKQHFVRLLTYRNPKKTQTGQSIPIVFLLCLKRNNPQTFKSGPAKTLFFNFYIIGTTKLLRRMFFIISNNWKTLLFMNGVTLCPTARYSKLYS